MNFVCGRHRCCRYCRPDLLLSGPRIGEHHVGVRFGKSDHHLHVFLDGVEQNGCFEAIAGEQGRIWRYIEHDDGHKHVCCRDAEGSPAGACFEVLDGQVDVRSLVA